MFLQAREYRNRTRLRVHDVENTSADSIVSGQRHTDVFVLNWSFRETDLDNMEPISGYRWFRATCDAYKTLYWRVDVHRTRAFPQTPQEGFRLMLISSLIGLNLCHWEPSHRSGQLNRRVAQPEDLTYPTTIGKSASLGSLVYTTWSADIRGQNANKVPCLSYFFMWRKLRNYWAPLALAASFPRRTDYFKLDVLIRLARNWSILYYTWALAHNGGHQVKISRITVHRNGLKYRNKSP